MDLSGKFNLRAPINNLGYGIHARGLISGLVELGCTDFHLSPIGEVVIESSPDELKNIRLLQNTPFNKQHPTIKIWHEFEMNDLEGSHLIAYPVFETTKLHPIAITQLQKMDGIMVTTQWAKQIMHHNIEKDIPVFVVNEAGQNFDLELEYEKYPDFTFLHVGKFETRKGTMFLIKSYSDLFEKSSIHTQLICHCYNPFDPQFEISLITILQHFGFEVSTSTGNPGFIIGRKGRAIVKIPTGRINREMLYEIYKSSHIGVFPSCGEGWNLELFEATVLGLPCIASFVSGHTEYTSPEHDYPQDLLLFKGTEKLADDKIWFHGDRGNWIEPDGNELREKMMYAFENYSSIIKSFNPEKIKTRFTWKNAARQFIEAVEKIRNV